MSREECRAAIVEELRANGHLVKEEDIEHSVGCCYRCKTVIEPYVSEQWFVATTRMAPQARAAVPELIRIFPDSWMKTYYNWLDNIRDWCISRQIWWGHRIPAWTCADWRRTHRFRNRPRCLPQVRRFASGTGSRRA